MAKGPFPNPCEYGYRFAFYSTRNPLPQITIKGTGLTYGLEFVRWMNMPIYFGTKSALRLDHILADTERWLRAYLLVLARLFISPCLGLQMRPIGTYLHLDKFRSMRVARSRGGQRHGAKGVACFIVYRLPPTHRSVKVKRLRENGQRLQPYRLTDRSARIYTRWEPSIALESPRNDRDSETLLCHEAKARGALDKSSWVWEILAL